ncbi:SLAM family member 9-like [Puntigrus tetrazona]|uniref:SLAM family member 9-like n=1 Tax=Puntigrus tetrazona TaxID=1606681 RepID=UPI001C8A41AD|nr:SLAM family member 9-like [Puntigrus tetrazona]
MFCSFVFCSLCFWHLVVIDHSDAVKTVSVTVGETVTLQTNVTQLQENDLILWTFGHPDSRIAEIKAGNVSTYDDVPDGRFRNRLKLDRQTGSLNITNSRTTDSGIYQMTIKSKKENTFRFSVTVYDDLPVPVISRDSSQCSSSSPPSCSLVCSSINSNNATLSWYKRNQFVSSVSLTHVSFNLSLFLEVEYQDKNPYSCVLKNPIGNRTTHLNFTQLCGTCEVVVSEGHAHCCDSVEAALRLVVTAVMGVAAATAVFG